jgi:hypothetical protein
VGKIRDVAGRHGGAVGQGGGGDHRIGDGDRQAGGFAADADRCTGDGTGAVEDQDPAGEVVADKNLEGGVKPVAAALPQPGDAIWITSRSK